MSTVLLPVAAPSLYMDLVYNRSLNYIYYIALERKYNNKVLYLTLDDSIKLNKFVNYLNTT